MELNFVVMTSYWMRCLTFDQGIEYPRTESTGTYRICFQ